MEKQYAEAIYRSSQQGTDPDVLMRTLSEHLRSRGRLKLLPRILRELKRLHARRSRSKDRIEIAGEQYRSEAIDTARSLGMAAEPVIVPDLVSGWRAFGKGSMIDRSGKRALLDLYRSITAPR